jgi:hypothetical protein
VEREHRKKESEDEEREWGRGIQGIESRWINWRDLSTSHADLTVATDTM